MATTILSVLLPGSKYWSVKCHLTVASSALQTKLTRSTPSYRRLVSSLASTAIPCLRLRYSVIFIFNYCILGTTLTGFFTEQWVCLSTQRIGEQSQTTLTPCTPAGAPVRDAWTRMSTRRSRSRRHDSLQRPHRRPSAVVAQVYRVVPCCFDQWATCKNSASPRDAFSFCTSNSAQQW